MFSFQIKIIKHVCSCVHGRIILRQIFGKWDEKGMDWFELAQDRDRCAGTCECGNEPSGFIKCGEFLDWLRTG